MLEMQPVRRGTGPPSAMFAALWQAHTWSVEADDDTVTWHTEDPQAYAALAQVVELERQCCPGLAFTLRVSSEGASLAVHGPPGTRDFVAAFWPEGAVPEIA